MVAKVKKIKQKETIPPEKSHTFNILVLDYKVGSRLKKYYRSFIFSVRDIIVLPKISLKIIFSGLIIIVFAVLLTNNGIAAQSADNILRPIIGEKNTLLIESFYFNLQDRFNYWYYLLFNPQPSVLPLNNDSNKRVKIKSNLSLSPIQTFFKFSPFLNDGIWKIVKTNAYPGEEVIAKTFIRPDITRPYAQVTLVKIDMQKIAIGTEAGTYYPGGIYKMYGPGIVPQTIQKENKLVAIFNGGFQARDGQYGMIVGKRVYVPLRENIPLLIITSDGGAKFMDYTGQRIDQGGDIAAIRQNGPYLIKNGVITSFNEGGLDTWGRTVTNSMYTWRSGLGITKKGNLIYAAGNSLLPQTLALALQDAGAINAIQLDINPFWVRFISYQTIGGGKYTFQPLLKSMPDTGNAYLKGYNKDFFYLYKK